MFLATQKNLPADVAIFAAAVADFKLKKKYQIKLKNKKP
jgi:phosphopantothenoylcysteine decarboxylase/phosphopantothenate--cysteine ligase